MYVTNVLMAGVGGQGIILASEVLARTAAASGLVVKKSEVHGMAQRGGAVTSHVRFGETVYSPLIPDGETDILMASELLEGLRWLPFLKPGGRVVLSTQQIPPPIVSRGDEPYPEGVLDKIRGRDPDVIALQCLEIASELGNPRTATVVLLGSLNVLLPFNTDTWLSILKAEVPEKAVEVNLKAFERGRELAFGGRT
jgi:indolepyruvate ferredoxin oxidoreductase beta subunit